MKNNTPLIIGAVLVIGFLVWVVSSSGKPGQLDAFAQCLDDKEVTFYGAFWCSHCANQKALFGKSVKFLPYVECSTADGNGMLQVCKDKNVASYPTWDFPPIGEATTTTRLTGEISLDKLAQMSGCSLPTASKAQ